MREIDSAKTLDEIKAAHDKYLFGIRRKSLLPSQDKENPSGEKGLGESVENLLYLSHSFCVCQQTLFGEALDAADRAAEKRKEAEERLTHGDWGFHSEKEVADEETFFGLSDGTKLEEIDKIAASFIENMRILLKALDNKLNGGPMAAPTDYSSPAPATIKHGLEAFKDEDDLDALRFLTSQLDNNQYYSAMD